MIKIYFLLPNYKGNDKNDYVDPNNNPVALSSYSYTKHFTWGSSWRIYDDSSDADQNMYYFY